MRIDWVGLDRTRAVGTVHVRRTRRETQARKRELHFESVTLYPSPSSLHAPAILRRAPITRHTSAAGLRMT